MGIDLRVAHPTLHGRRCRLELWDTAGQERFRAITTAYFRKADAIAVCYRCDDRESFDHVAMWLQSIRQSCPSGVTCGIVATRADSEVVVPHETGQALANGNNSQFWVTSAKTGLNVAEAITSLAENSAVVTSSAANSTSTAASNNNTVELNDPQEPHDASNSKCKC